VTQVGRVLRQTGIDRLPQLINVLLGGMSIVGPRPSTSPQHWCNFRLLPMLADVKPGMISGAQITEYRHGLDAMDQRIKDDLYYVKNRSLFFDIKKILATVISVR
jgi:lipopolysaccharide/colanic/teichoic acid biosynthesis glycosyltransferase